MKVLLLTPPFVRGFMRNARWDVITISGAQWYPIYLAYSTGLLEREGHEAKLLDAQVDNLSHEQTYQIARDFSPELIVLYYSSKARKNDLEVAEKLQEITGVAVVLVGPSTSIDSDETLRTTSLGMLAAGEFDFTVLELANKVPREQIKGLVWKNSEGEIRVNPGREPVPAEELDKFLFVTDVYRRHLNIKSYFQPDQLHPFIDLFTGRGCAWGKCTFCLWPHTINKGAGYRTRQIPNVIEELKFVRSEMPDIKEIFIQDDTLPRERAVALSEAILENKLKLCWSCYLRPTGDHTPDSLKLLRRAGCRTVHIGYESSNQQILKNIRKGTTLETMEKFTRNASDAGLFIVADFITGLPGETVATIKATTKWARKLPVQRYCYTLPKPFPGTPFYQWLVAHDCLRDGRPDYPGLPAGEIYKWNKWSLIRVFLSPRYLFAMLTRPYEWDRMLRAARYFLPYVFSREKKDTLDLEW